MTDTKRCPYCAEDIRREAIKCRYCGSVLDGRPPAASAMSEPWTRSRRGAMIAGVCAGLAKRFEISVTVVRLAFVIAALMSFGTGVLLYVVFWVVMPVEEEGHRPRLDEHPGYEPIE